MSVWTVSLSQVWGISHLPVVCCETRTDASGLKGRVLFPENNQPTTAWIPLSQPLKLSVHREAKPWGCEIWYTGIEERGVCAVDDTQGGRVPLPAYLELAAGPRSDNVAQPVELPLLKILEPRAEMESGCLYIEVHKEKWETYFISNIDETSWPQGVGKVLYGFSQAKMSAFANNETRFKAALQADVLLYQSVRNAIDALPQSEVDNSLRQKEAQLWQTVRSYFEFIDVRVGDVIRVPPFIPHSLQNGVQVVEFQTPTYERLILAFNQKVLTQNHWDTEQALHLALFKSGAQLHSELTTSALSDHAPLWAVAVDFPGFQVLSAEIKEQEQKLELPANSQGYSVVYVLTGAVEFNLNGGPVVLRAEAGEAALIPAHVNKEALSLTASQPNSKLLFV